MTIPQKPTRYRPELDGIRTLCIILTINNHTQFSLPFLVGSIGVDVFFALSGWLICTLLVQEAQRSGTIDLRAFYIRRLFRIVPLYFLTMLLYVAAAGTLALAGSPADWADLGRVWIWLVSFCSEYRPPDAPNLFGHAWTLGIEEKFYIIGPLLVLVGLRSRAFALAGLVASIVVLLALGGSGAELARGYFGLSFGSILALAAARNQLASQVLASRGMAGVSCVLVVGAYGAALNGVGLPANLAIAAGAGLGIAFLWLCPGTVGSRMLGWAPLAWLGKLTYGIYLIHVLVLNGVNRLIVRFDPDPPPIFAFILGYGAAVLAAWVLHIALERPLIGLGRRLAARS